VVHITTGLAETLLRFGREHDPESVTTTVSVTAAGDLEDADLPAETPVFTHFYLPNAGGSVNAVFGVDLGTPAGQTHGRFVSHPMGEEAVTKRDDLAPVVFVATPPWDVDALVAFDRRGRRQDLSLIDATPPEEELTN
jgi:hypothetical protein